MTKGRKHYLLKIFDQTLMDFSIDVDSMGSIYVDIIDIIRLSAKGTNAS